jgi:NAD(P)-dependent dehydrogenase (short-subunit alcohol dehydrogenase family)
LNSSEMVGKVCVVTGSSSGIGKETALGLAELGATVVMVVRDQRRGETAKEEIISKTQNKEIRLEVCDLLSMSATRELVRRLVKSYARLDVLVNNAGGVFSKRQTTAEGFERTLALNYLAPVLIARGSAPLLASSAPSRVIDIGSREHSRGRIDFGDLQMAKRYSSRRAYSNAKLMLTMFTYEFARRLGATEVTANLVQPGFVATNLGKNSGSRLQSVMFGMMRPSQISARKAAETPVYLSSSSDVKGVTGKCYSKQKEVKTSQASYDEEMQKRLWEVTSELLSMPKGPGYWGS